MRKKKRSGNLFMNVWWILIYPGTKGYMALPHSFLMTWRSVWQSPQKRTLIVTSPSLWTLMNYRHQTAHQFSMQNGKPHVQYVQYSVYNKLDNMFSSQCWMAKEIQIPPWEVERGKVAGGIPCSPAVRLHASRHWKLLDLDLILDPVAVVRLVRIW